MSAGRRTNGTLGYFTLLRQFRFTTLWVGRIVSGIGDMLFTMATMWYVLTLTHSAVQTAVVPMISMVAFMFFGLPMGAIVDRLPKKSVLIISDIVRGIVILLVWLFMMDHVSSVWVIYIANALLSVIGIMFNPALQASLPRLLQKPDDQLTLANALLGATSQAINLFGYGIGGLLVAVLHTTNAVLLDGLSFFVSALTFLPIAIPRIVAAATPGLSGFVHDTFAGVRFLWSIKVVRVLIWFGAVINVFVAPLNILTVTFANNVLHGGVAYYGYLEMATIGGGIVGTLVSGKLAWRLRMWQWLFISLFLMGWCITALNIHPHLVMSMVWVALAMASLSLLNVPLYSAVQLLVPDEIQGRALNSYRLLIMGISMPFGLIGGSWVINVMGVRQTFLVVGVLTVITSLLSLCFSTLRRSTDLDVRQQLASEASA